MREDGHRKAKPTLGLIDAQSVKNASCAGEKGYDAGKKTSGIKRHIVVDTMGLLHGFLVTTADETDRNGASVRATLRSESGEHYYALDACRAPVPLPLQGRRLLLDELQKAWYSAAKWATLSARKRSAGRPLVPSLAAR